MVLGFGSQLHSFTASQLHSFWRWTCVCVMLLRKIDFKQMC
ncbi:TPA: Tfp pilus assembly protein [Vibrio cholerae]|nr:Tfp pilus assembly protein [Vibrio cholerae]